MGETESARVVCRECGFSAEVGSVDDRLPAEVVIAHGREFGQKLSVESAE